MITLQVKDKFELMAIHKLIYKSKFAENPPLKMAVFSPSIARFANEVVSKIIEVNSIEGNDKEAKGWTEMMDINKEDHHVELFKKYVSEGDWWGKLNSNEKNEHVLAFFSPLRLSKQITSDLMNYES